jgi:site-specific recombinase XerD
MSDDGQRELIEKNGVTSQVHNHDKSLSDYQEALRYEGEIGRIAKETARTYQSIIKAWKTHLNKEEKPTPESTDLYQWISYLRASGKSAVTCNKYLSALRACYQWLFSHKRYLDIAHGIKPMRFLRDGPLPAFTKEEVLKMLTSEDNRENTLSIELKSIGQLRDECLIRIIYSTGVRVISLVRMNLDDVQANNPNVLIKHQSKGRDEKTDIAVLPHIASRKLQQYLEARKKAGLNQIPLWIGLRPQPGSRLSDKSIREIVNKRAEQLGHRERDSKGKLLWPRVYGPHCLRRSASVAVIDKFGLEAGQILLGHSSSDQTRQGYARVDKLRILNRVAQSLDLEP